jgi:hypothetical protein
VIWLLAPQELLMAMIEITCPDCNASSSIPARTLFATLDLDGFREPLGRLSWACLSCDSFVTAELEVKNLLHLLTAGVPLLDDGFGSGTVAEACQAPRQLHAEQQRTGAPFTLDDVLTLHGLLKTETWVQQLTERPDT